LRPLETEPGGPAYFRETPERELYGVYLRRQVVLVLSACICVHLRAKLFLNDSRAFVANSF